MKSYVFTLLALALAGCAKQSSHQAPASEAEQVPIEEQTQVYLQGDEIIYQGPIDPAANEQMFKLYQDNTDVVKTLAITSPGGEVGFGMDLGAFVFDNELNVRVNQFCFSSCANYVFPSGKTKYLASNAVVGFHGSASSQEFEMEPGMEENQEMQAQLKAYLVQVRDREDSFYRKIGVNPLLPILGQNGNFEQFNDYVGWYYSPQTLALFQVKNIEVTGSAWKFDQNSFEGKLFEIPFAKAQAAINEV